MEALKKERSMLRRNFSNKSNIFVKKLEDVKNQKDFFADVEILSNTINKIFILDDEIMKKLIIETDIDEENLLQEQEQSDVYRHKWANIQELNNGRKVREDEEVRSLHNFSNTNFTKRNFNLPKLELFKFDGEVKNWIAFWGQFQKIHNDDSIDQHDKFQYLLQATEKGSKARSLVESFPPSSDNYTIAIRHLKDRFARDELIIEVYVRKLLTLIITQTKRNHQMSLDELYDKLNTQLRALETLGVTTDKYAAMLFPIVESALSVEVLKAWQRSQIGSGNNDSGKLLNNLLEFLKFEVEGNQRISLARAGFSGNDNTVCGITNTEVQPSTASCLVETNKAKLCIWCDKPSHSSAECYKMSRLSLEERITCLKKKKGCTLCLKSGHHASQCKSFLKCILCSKKHNIIMCPQLPSEQDKNKCKEVVTQNTELSLSHCTSITILQTLLVKIVYNNKYLVVRALFDNGAQRSYLKKNIIDELKLPMVAKESLAHCVFGGIETKRKVHSLYNITLVNIHNNFEFKMNVLDENKICGSLPTVKTSELCYETIQKHNINLTDVSSHPLEIGLLIGADYSGYLYTGNMVELNNGLFAVNTRLGWTVQGQQSGVCNTATILNCQNNVNISEIRDLEFIGIRDPVETKSEEMLECEIIKSFHNTVNINNEGSYEVHLPWKENRNTLLSNYELAKKRLLSTTKRLISTDNYKHYQDVFDDWMQRGVIEVINDVNKKGHYLPHHAVIKESSLTTRVRHIFDASANRECVKFLWWKDGKQKEIVTYRHRRVVLGSAPPKLDL